MEGAEGGELFGHEGSDADVLEPDRVYHATGRFADSRRRVSRHRLERQAFHYEAAETVQIDNRSELDSVAEGSTGGNDWVFEVEGADADSEVNFRGPWDACRLGRTHGKKSTTRVKKSGRDGGSAAAIPGFVC